MNNLPEPLHRWRYIIAEDICLFFKHPTGLGCCKQNDESGSTTITGEPIWESFVTCHAYNKSKL